VGVILGPFWQIGEWFAAVEVRKWFAEPGVFWFAVKVGERKCVGVILGPFWQISNLKSQISNFKFQISNLKFRVENRYFWPD
jgi:hypothetical protein